MSKKGDLQGKNLSAAEVKTKVRSEGSSLKHWAYQNGYPYDTVSQVVRGINRGTFGLGYEIAKKLGMK